MWHLLNCYNVSFTIRTTTYSIVRYSIMTRSIPLWRILLRYDVFSFPWRVRSWFLRYSFVSIYRRKSRARKQRPRRRSGRKSPSFWPRIRRGVSQLGCGAGDPWREAWCAGIGRMDVLRTLCVCCGHDSVCSARLVSSLLLLLSWSVILSLSVLQAQKHWIKTEGGRSHCCLSLSFSLTKMFDSDFLLIFWFCMSRRRKMERLIVILWLIIIQTLYAENITPKCATKHKSLVCNYFQN